MSDEIRRDVDTVFGLAQARPDLAADLSAANADEALRDDPRPFSPFRHSDAVKAAELAGKLNEIADAAGEQGAIGAVTAAAADVARNDPGLARHALGLFAAHHPGGGGRRSQASCDGPQWRRHPRPRTRS